MNQPTEIVIYDPVSYALLRGDGMFIFCVVILWGFIFAGAMMVLSKAIERSERPYGWYIVAGLAALLAEYFLFVVLPKIF